MKQTDKAALTDRLSHVGLVTPTLEDILKDVPKLDTAPDPGREQIEYIDIGLIDRDPGNFYKLTQLEELASNIAVVGLQQPLRVRVSEKDPQRVVVVSGHRRQAALDKAYTSVKSSGPCHSTQDNSASLAVSGFPLCSFRPIARNTPQCKPKCNKASRKLQYPQDK